MFGLYLCLSFAFSVCGFCKYNNRLNYNPRALYKFLNILFLSTVAANNVNNSFDTSVVLALLQLSVHNSFRQFVEPNAEHFTDFIVLIFHVFHFFHLFHFFSRLTHFHWANKHLPRSINIENSKMNRTLFKTTLIKCSISRRQQSGLCKLRLFYDQTKQQINGAIFSVYFEKLMHKEQRKGQANWFWFIYIG